MRRALLALALPFLVVTAASGDADAEPQPFVDAPLSLPPLHFRGDVGLGFGQYEGYSIDPNNPSAAPIPLGNKVGFGSNLEAAVGLPFVGELGARVGYRFSDVGADAQADHYARLFDPVVNEPGSDALANPEIYLRGTLVPLDVFELGLETRAIIPTASNCAAATSGIKLPCYFALTPGVPMRIHIPGFMRIDTGLYLPVAFDSHTDFSLQVPAQAFFRIQDAFVGPLTGLRYDHNTNSDGTSYNTTHITAGVGGGYTLGGTVDLKAQLYTDQIDTGEWAKHIGGGLGVGLRVP
jgi:hypothetical protein